MLDQNESLNSLFREVEIDIDKICVHEINDNYFPIDNNFPDKRVATVDFYEMRSLLPQNTVVYEKIEQAIRSRVQSDTINNINTSERYLDVEFALKSNNYKEFFDLFQSFDLDVIKYRKSHAFIAIELSKENPNFDVIEKLRLPHSLIPSETRHLLNIENEVLKFAIRENNSTLRRDAFQNIQEMLEEVSDEFDQESVTEIDVDQSIIADSILRTYDVIFEALKSTNFHLDEEEIKVLKDSISLFPNVRQQIALKNSLLRIYTEIENVYESKILKEEIISMFSIDQSQDSYYDWIDFHLDMNIIGKFLANMKSYGQDTNQILNFIFDQKDEQGNKLIYENFLHWDLIFDSIKLFDEDNSVNSYYNDFCEKASEDCLLEIHKGYFFSMINFDHVGYKDVLALVDELDLKFREKYILKSVLLEKYIENGDFDDGIFDQAMALLDDFKLNPIPDLSLEESNEDFEVLGEEFYEIENQSLQNDYYYVKNTIFELLSKIGVQQIKIGQYSKATRIYEELGIVHKIPMVKSILSKRAA